MDLDELEEVIRGILVLIFLGFFLWTIKDIEPFKSSFEAAISTVIFIGKIILTILTVGAIGYISVKIYFWREDKKIEEEVKEQLRMEEERRRRYEEEMRAKGYVKYITIDGEEKWGTPEEAEKYNYVAQIVQAIKDFQPPTKYGREMGYQHTLFAWLKSRFPKTKMEEQKGASRPDIVIEDIAIEVKGPTGSQELQTIADKVMRYMRYYNHLIIVLFDIRASPKRYQEWYEGIKASFPEVIIIEK